MGEHKLLYLLTYLLTYIKTQSTRRTRLDFGWHLTVPRAIDSSVYIVGQGNGTPVLTNVVVVGVRVVIRFSIPYALTFINRS